MDPSRDEGRLDIRVEVGTLLEAIDHTAAVRHARGVGEPSRGVGELPRPYVDALLELDSHESLLQVSEQLRESDWVKEEIRDRQTGSVLWTTWI